MKRSKMVLVIQDILQERFGFEDAPAYLADAMLTAAEEAGMLPPNSSSVITIEFDGIETSMIRNGNFWEPEHE